MAERAIKDTGRVVALPGHEAEEPWGETAAPDRPIEAPAPERPADSAGLPDSDGRAEHVWRAARILSGGLLLVWLVAWPLGSSLAERAVTGTFSLRFGYTLDVVLFAVTTSALLLGAGYALAAGIRLEDSAERLRQAAAGFAGALGPRGAQAQDEIGALNAEIDRALQKLAGAESLIRRQVQAIGEASAALEGGAAERAAQIEAERAALMALTEEINKEAEAFAAAIAERSQNASVAGQEIEAKITAAGDGLDGQIKRLEDVSARSLETFQSLATAMDDRSGALAAQADEQSEATKKLGDNQTALGRAQAELAEQSERLERLIKDQRKRADRIARAVTDQTSRLARLSARQQPEQRRGAWRDILTAVERNLPATTTQKPQIAAVSGETAGDDMDRLILRMQRFAITMRTQLYGGPSRGDLDAFERGETMVFVRRLLEEDAEDLKRRIGTEARRNAVFDETVQEFLADFDSLLEPVAASGEGDAAIADYLRSPLGRLYILTGTATGRFSR